MKKYYFNWYNYIAQQEQTDFILAKDITEAKQIAIFIMRFFAGERYGVDDIETIDEVSDSYYYTMEEMRERYNKAGKEFILPEIKEDDEED